MRESRIGFVVLTVSVLIAAAGPSGIARASDGVVFANYNQMNRVCESDGIGGFVCTDVSTDMNYTEGVALGLVDADPHLDAVFANGVHQRNRVCFGDGVGGFVGCEDVSTDEYNSDDAAVGSINGDQGMDIVIANVGEPNRVCLADGGGGFTCSDVSADVNNSFAVALGFVDDDPRGGIGLRR